MELSSAALLRPRGRCSPNALRLGLFAKCVVLSNESPAGFQEWRGQSMDRCGPFDGVEEALVEEMSAAFSSLAGRPELSRIHRYEARFHTMYQRALCNLFLLRTPRDAKRTQQSTENKETPWRERDHFRKKPTPPP